MLPRCHLRGHVFFIFMRMSLGKVEISRLHGLGEEKLNFVRKKKKKRKEIAQDKKKKGARRQERRKHTAETACSTASQTAPHCSPHVSQNGMRTSHLVYSRIGATHHMGSLVEKTTEYACVR